MNFRLLTLSIATALAIRAAEPGACELIDYKAQPGLMAESRGGSLYVTWQGSAGAELRAVFATGSKQPVIRELAARKGDGEWAALGRDLTPEYEVTSGVRRISEQQLAPLRKLGKLNPEYLEQQKWNAFWDAPLNVPGEKGTNADMPRHPEEIRRATATYDLGGCKVKTDGARLEVTFPGVSMGIFSGQLMYTVYKGTNLLRQEVVAKTDEPSVAYKYRAGLKGFRTDLDRRVVWRDTSRGWQKYEFGGSPNRDPVALKARSRLAVVETDRGALAFFPPPHKFFFAREIEVNLGYVWYRKDDANSFSIGIRHGDREEMYKPYGVSDEEWRKRVNESRHNAANFALYNAPQAHGSTCRCIFTSVRMTAGPRMKPCWRSHTTTFTSRFPAIRSRSAIFTRTSTRCSRMPEPLTCNPRGSRPSAPWV